MFKEKSQFIQVREDAIIVGNRTVPWDDILGIRKYASPILYQFSTAMPYIVLFLRGGKVVRVYRKLDLTGIPTHEYNDNFKMKFKELFTVINEVEKRAVNLRNEISQWIEWRVFVLILFFQVIVLFAGIFINPSLKGLEDTIKFGLSGSVIPFVVGIIWEIKARKARWR
ncbi:hypothetical protein ACFLZI_03710 [Nitrospirota bacterium]